MVSKDTNLLIPWETKKSNVVFYLKSSKKSFCYRIVHNKKRIKLLT